MSEKTSTDGVVKPSAIRDETTAPFFDGAARGRLMLQSCTVCGCRFLTGSKMCPDCLSPMTWTESSGKGKVYSWAVVHQATHPAFADEVPYLVGTIKLDEGPKIMGRFVDLEHKDMRVGLPVQVSFKPCPNGESVPVFEYFNPKGGTRS